MDIVIVPIARRLEPRQAADCSMEVKNWNSNPELLVLVTVIFSLLIHYPSVCG